MDYYQNMIQATNEKNSFMLHNGIRLTKMERTTPSWKLISRG